MHSSQIPHESYLRLSQIIGDAQAGVPALIPVSKSTWWSWCKSGKAPRPIRLSAGVTVWRRADVVGFAESLSGQPA